MRRRQWWMGLGLAATAGGLGATTLVPARRELIVTSFPDLDRAARIAIPAFERLHPGVRVRSSESE